ncbi:MAG: MarR family transcriptional regulator [Desulfobacterales bacterium]|nr:MarR family transcriptional regulator [Desulfobacterales bacterium]
MFKKFAPESVGRRLNFLFRISKQHLRQEMKKLGVGEGDYAFIAILFVMDGLSQDELSRQMRVDKSYTARAVAKLEKMGMVERRPDPDEHRIKRVFLAKRAREMELDVFNVLKGWHDTLVKGIDPEELAVIQAGLDRMIENGQSALGLEPPDESFFRK